MDFTPARSAEAAVALQLVSELQSHLAAQLSPVVTEGSFAPVTWLRDEGRHGGGTRLTYGRGRDFNRASLNVSQVHYDDQPERPLGSATALSSIIHPEHPLWPSLHLHISWTEMKAGSGYWRIMADLNPAIPDEADKVRFVAKLREAAGEHFALGTRLGDQYFHIPALGRHRGVAHFYLEQFHSGDAEADRVLARRFGRTMIDAYTAILIEKRGTCGAPDPEQWSAQLAYHTLYLFQVLTLDRGTTSGLLVHDQNDVGILGSLPSRVDPLLLRSWEKVVAAPQAELVAAIAAILPADGRVDDDEKIALCQAVRAHYRRYPTALELQAKADVVPPTVRNHA